MIKSPQRSKEVATRRSSFAAIALLLGAALAQAGPLHQAAGAGDAGKVRALLAEGADIAEMTPLGTPLHWAALKGQLAAAELLVAEGAPLDEPAGPLGFTPLHLAALGGSSDVTALLAGSGSDMEARDARGNTPLHLAASAGHLAAAETLVAAGADLTARNVSDESPIQLAGLSGHFDIVDLLTAHGVSVPPVDPVTQLLATADPEQGRALFLGCKPCHTIARNDRHGPGPNLWSVLEREKASAPAYDYSPALARLEGRWTYEDLNAFLADPTGFTPGTRMRGLKDMTDAADRASLILFLRANGDDPPPLPE